MRYELHGFTYLMEVLDLTLRDAESQSSGVGLSDQQVDLCVEILKILFNLTLIAQVEKKAVDEVIGPRYSIVDKHGITLNSLTKVVTILRKERTTETCG